jgi:hypothetical protein
MAEQNQTRSIPALDKVVTEQAARFEAAFAEVAKLQSKGVAQMTELVEKATKVAQEQIAFAEQVGGEWRKIVLAASRNAAELFAPKS